jgi:CheY-like chemotaxis protein
MIADALSGRSRHMPNATEPRRVKVLLIGENPQGSLYLAKRLQGRGCECQFALSYQKACELLGVQRFDLVLSPLRLPSGSMFPLVSLLEGFPISLFYFEPVENGCWWLPALRNGHNCFGSSALLPSEFVPAIDEIIDQIRSCETGEKKTELSVVPSLPISPATTPSSGESPSSEPKHSEILNALQRKAAG